TSFSLFLLQFCCLLSFVFLQLYCLLSFVLHSCSQLIDTHEKSWNALISCRHRAGGSPIQQGNGGRTGTFTNFLYLLQFRLTLLYCNYLFPAHFVDFKVASGISVFTCHS